MEAALSLPLVRRRLTRRARSAWEGHGPVTFVCFGNICRSPFAESLASRRLGSARRISSAGTFQRAGRPSPETAASVARRWDVDLAAHRSRVLDAPAVHQGGSIFVFDVDNLLRVRRDFPEARHRVHLLGALAEKGPLGIRDPYGQPAEEFAAVYGRIAHLIACADAGGARSGH